MRHSFLCFACLLSAAAAGQNADSLQLRNIYDYYLTESDCYSNLGFLSTEIGGRLSGSPQAAKAVEWAAQAMRRAGADTVFLQPCMVPRWVRGPKEQCRLLTAGKQQELKCTALGSSVGTGEKGITAEVVEVRSFEALEDFGEQALRGKIIFYNVFFDQRKINTGDAYGEAVKYRSRGASHAAKYGAVACLVRSMTTVADDEPHTGNMFYDTSVSQKKIPAVALSYKSADQIQEALKTGGPVKVYLKTSCANLDSVLSYNVIGQINGVTNPGEFIVAGGHLDSWDNGEGAHDDGAGIVQSIEVLRAFKKLGIKPHHSLRAVAFMNEENGLAGGTAYAKQADAGREVHLAAIESDAGGFVPRGFSVDTARGLYREVITWKPLFEPYLVDHFEKDGGGADLIALEKLGVPCIGFIPDTQRYFDIHHTAADTFGKINRRELELGGAAIAALVFLLDRHYDETRK